MTNPNWWDVEPYKIECKSTAHDLYTFFPHCDGTRYLYDIPAIIAEVEKRGETSVTQDGSGEVCIDWYKCGACEIADIMMGSNFCPHCGARISWDK